MLCLYVTFNAASYDDAALHSGVPDRRRVLSLSTSRNALRCAVWSYPCLKLRLYCLCSRFVGSLRLRRRVPLCQWFKM